MRATTRWFTAALFILVLMAIGCGADLSKLPPIVISAPPPSVPAQPTAPATPMATVAFHVVDDATGAPIPIAIATFEDETKVQANDDGYIAIEKQLDTYQVKISATDYVTHIVDVILTGNRQFEVRLASSKPKPEPARDLRIVVSEIQPGGPASNSQWVPLPNGWCIVNGDKRNADSGGVIHFTVTGPVDAECGAPTKLTRRERLDQSTSFTLYPDFEAPPAPPVVSPQPTVSLLEEAAGWSDEQWRVFILPLLQKTGDRVNEANLKIVRPDLVARGADFQNGWRGDMRARVFLPVPGCSSSAITPDPLPCAYNRTFDLGLNGELWQWIKR